MGCAPTHRLNGEETGGGDDSGQLGMTTVDQLVAHRHFIGSIKIDRERKVIIYNVGSSIYEVCEY